jgi:hypothetical protein
MNEQDKEDVKKMKRRRRLRKMSLEAKGFPIEEGLVSSLGLFQVTHAYTNKIYVSRSNLIRSSIDGISPYC